MEPKFQSSFIPKGNFAVPGAVSAAMTPKKKHSLLGFIAMSIFFLAVIGAFVAFAYSQYLSYSIGKMITNLQNSRESVEPDKVNELIRTDRSITSTQKLLSTHIAISPFFALLESLTLKSVRFTDLAFTSTEKGLGIVMKGQAKGYQALSLQSDNFNNSKYFSNVVFSDIRLDQQGNVTFSVRMNIDPSLVSYASTVVNRQVIVATTTSQVATTTVKTVSTTATTSVSTTTKQR